MAHPKGLLIERAQRLGIDRPEFQTTQTGPEHEPSFVTDVVLAGEVLGTGQGQSKRDAERRAAEEALAELDTRDGGASKAKPTKKGAAKKPAANTAAGKPSGNASAKVTPAAEARTVAPQAKPEPSTEASADEPFTGPWPMVDDVLASVITVAERRVSADLRGDQALDAIRDFSLRLYKEILADLGEVVEED